MNLPNVVARLFSDVKPSNKFSGDHQRHPSTYDFIEAPDFSRFSFRSQVQKLSYHEIHEITFLDKRHVKWCTALKYSLGINSTEEWIGKYEIDLTQRIVVFKFQTSTWFHQVPYHYYFENRLKRGEEPVILLMADCDEYLEFRRSCLDSEPGILNLMNRKCKAAPWIWRGIYSILY
jgi:hypothetical protein